MLAPVEMASALFRSPPKASFTLAFFVPGAAGSRESSHFSWFRAGLYFSATYPSQSRQFRLHFYWDVHHECFYVRRFRCPVLGHRSFCNLYACCCRLLHFLLRRVCSQGFSHPRTSSCSSLAFWLCPCMILFLPPWTMNSFVLDVTSFNPKADLVSAFLFFWLAPSFFRAPYIST